jgi:hypothetical protein
VSGFFGARPNYCIAIDPGGGHSQFVRFQAEHDELDIRFRKRERLSRHLDIISGIPAGLHDAGIRMPVSSLKHMSDFMRQDVCQQILHSAWRQSFDAIVINSDVYAFVRARISQG